MSNMIKRNNSYGLFDPFFDEFFANERNSNHNEVMKTDIKDEGDHYF